MHQVIGLKDFWITNIENCRIISICNIHLWLFHKRAQWLGTWGLVCGDFSTAQIRHHIGLHQCNVMQHYCNVMQHAATHKETASRCSWIPQHAEHIVICCTLQHVAAHCNTTQHTKIRHHFGLHYCNTLQHTATHCNTLQYTSAYCNTHRYGITLVSIAATQCNTLQHTATQCITQR